MKPVNTCTDRPPESPHKTPWVPQTDPICIPYARARAPHTLRFQRTKLRLTKSSVNIQAQAMKPKPVVLFFETNSKGKAAKSEIEEKQNDARNKFRYSRHLWSLCCSQGFALPGFPGRSRARRWFRLDQSKIRVVVSL
jgi:hypothetical protein